MSLLITLLAGTAINYSQLCYHSEQDTGSHHWLAQVSLLETDLLPAVKNRQNICIPLKNQKEYQEAEKLLAADETTQTLTIEHH